VSIFAAWGLAQATLGLLCIVVLVRYRALRSDATRPSVPVHGATDQVVM